MPYAKQNWENFPSTSSPLSAARLNHLETQYENAVADVQGALSTKADLSGGRVPDNQLGVSQSTVANTIPKRTTSGRLPGIGDPSATTDAVNKRYVDQSVDATASSLATIDELIFSTVLSCWYSGSTAIVEFTNTQSTTLMIAPFALEVTSVDVSFERYNLAVDANNVARAHLQRRRADATETMTFWKSTTSGSGGEAITARRPWSLTDAGFNGDINRLQKGDLLSVNMGTQGSAPPIQYPMTFTVNYRPL